MSLKESLNEMLASSNPPRWRMYPINLGNFESAFYDADAEYQEYEDAVEQLSEMYILHNNEGIKCTNLINSNSPVGCLVCQRETNDPYFVWKLSLRVKRLEL